LAAVWELCCWLLAAAVGFLYSILFHNNVLATLLLCFYLYATTICMYKKYQHRPPLIKQKGKRTQSKKDFVRRGDDSFVGIAGFFSFTQCCVGPLFVKTPVSVTKKISRPDFEEDLARQ
jgi:uncharacterized membrane protein YfcA